MKTLVLSTGFQPLDIVTWQRAMTMYFSGRVEVVEPYRDRRIGTVSRDVEMPAVVRFVRSVFRRYVSPKVRLTRRNLYHRDGGRCQYCSQALGYSVFTIDHVIPRSRQGRHEWENVVAACRPCNRRKANRTPKQVGFSLLARPRKPEFVPDARDHYPQRWNAGMPDLWRPFMTS